MKLERMTQGMVLWDYGRDKTVLRRKVSWPVRVLEVNLATRQVLASWNYNKASWVPERHATKWRLKPYKSPEATP